MRLGLLEQTEEGTTGHSHKRRVLILIWHGLKHPSLVVGNRVQ